MCTSLLSRVTVSHTMSSSQDIYQQLINQMTRGAVPFILLFLGTSGSVGNLITFTSKDLRKRSCAFYFLCMAIFELLTICFGLISRIADQFGSTLQSQSRVYCKIRYYFALAFPTVATYLLLLAAIDRCMSTSISARCRAFCQLKIAYHMVPLVVMICFVACSHTLIFVDHQPSCIPQPGPYALFYSVYLISFSSIFPNLLLFFFGLWTIRNVKIARRRVRVGAVPVTQRLRRQQRTDAQFVVMVVSQAIVSCVVDVTRMSCYAYYLLAANHSKSSYQQTVDTFIFQVSIVLSYFNYSESFYTNTLTSALFRKTFRRTCYRYTRQIIQSMTNICRRQDQNPVNVTPSDDLIINRNPRVNTTGKCQW